MKVIVTGGAGFIGSHLVEYLSSEGHSVKVIDNFSTGRKENLEHVRDKIEIIEGDLNTFEDLPNLIKGNDWVFHLAALADIVPSIQNPEQYFNANVISNKIGLIINKNSLLIVFIKFLLL